MATGINYYNTRVCLNVLAGSLDNAREIYAAAEKHVEVGVLTADYPDVPSAIEDMEKYMDVLEGNLSVGLGGGNPNQWRALATSAKMARPACSIRAMAAESPASSMASFRRAMASTFSCASRNISSTACSPVAYTAAGASTSTVRGGNSFCPST